MHLDQELVAGMQLDKRPMLRSIAGVDDQRSQLLQLVDDLGTLKALRTIPTECIGKVLLTAHPIEPWCCCLLKSHLGNQVRSLLLMQALSG